MRPRRSLRTAATAPFHVTALLGAAVGVVASGGSSCTFDDSALEDRGPCETNRDCPDGVCLEGNCWYGELDDVGVDAPRDTTPPPDATDAETDSRVCEPGAASCVGNVAQVCSADGRRVESTNCSAPENCSAAQGCLCEAGACEPRLCLPGARVCEGETQVLVCDPTGTELREVATCEEGTTCIGGSCVETLCEPGDVYCAGTAIVRCDESGAPIVSVECADAARTCVDLDDGARCVEAECTPGSARCSASGVPEACDATGERWVRLAPCTGGTACDAGVCLPRICTPNQTSCADETTQRTCNATGTAADEIACLPGTGCVDGACFGNVCEPGATFCNDRVVARCSDDGTGFTNLETCPSSCLDGACVEAFCGDGITQPERGETCDDGNDVDCDGCEACHAIYAARTLSGSSVEPTAAFDIGTADVTLEAWVRRSGADGPLFGVGTIENNGSLHVALNANRIQATMRLGGPPTERVVVTGPEVLTTDVWTHIAVHRFGQRNLVLWVNGQPVASGRTTGTQTQLRPDVGVWVASDGTTPATPLLVSELRASVATVYTRPFLPDRFLADPDATVAVQLDANEGSGSVLADRTSEGRDLTIEGVVWEADTCYGAPAGAATCGDGVRARWEACDDGNRTDGDGCSADCQVETECADDEIPGPHGACYFVTRPLNWAATNDLCEDRGMGLATVESAHKHLFLFHHVAPGQVSWIGLNDREREGTFVWSRGSGARYRFWAPNRPLTGPAGADADCAAVSLRTDGSWLDLDCNSNRPGLCER